MAVSGAVILAVVLLAVVHVDDRYGVSAAGGVWMGLSSALQHGVFYPAVYAHGFYGGTRYMPLPFIFETAGGLVTGELLVAAKLVIYATAAGLYVLLFVILRRRGAPWPVALGLIGAVLVTYAAVQTTLAIRWDALATLLQLGAIAVVADHPRSGRRVSLAGLLCALALASKFSALWALVAIVIWLAFVARGSLVRFLAWFAGSAVVLGAVFELLSSGRFHENVRLFAFGGSDYASTFDGAHRLYQLALRDQREGALLLVLAGAAVVLTLAVRKVGPYEIALVVCWGGLLLIMRDQGAYENHLLDLLVLAAVVVAGAWHALPAGRAADVWRLATVGAILLATILSVRYTLWPDGRAALSHELRGRTDPKFAIDDLSGPGNGACDLYEDASMPILAGYRPVVLDAFMVHRLQTRRPEQLQRLVRRVQRGEFPRIWLTTTLDDVGWFAVLDFGSALASAMRDNYRLASHREARNLYVYVPKKGGGSAICRPPSLRNWR